MKHLFIGLAALVTLPALAVEPAGAPAPASGYVDFDELSEQYGEARVMINVSGSLLRLARAMEHRDPIANAVLHGMESVRIRVYDTQGDTAPASERINSLSARLVADSWESVVRSREDRKNVAILVRQDAQRIHGITVMAVDDEEAVFINVLGEIDPDQIGEVIAQMDLDVDMDLEL